MPGREGGMSEEVGAMVQIYMDGECGIGIRADTIEFVEELELDCCGGMCGTSDRWIDLWECLKRALSSKSNQA